MSRHLSTVMFSNDPNYFVVRRLIEIGRELFHARKGHILDYGLDLGLSQVEALVFLDSVPAATIRTLREYLEISHQGTCDMVGRLSQKGLVESRPGLCDKRAKHLFLTEKGREICMDQKKRASEVGARLFARLDEEEKKTAGIPAGQDQPGMMAGSVPYGTQRFSVHASRLESCRARSLRGSFSSGPRQASGRQQKAFAGRAASAAARMGHAGRNVRSIFLIPAFLPRKKHPGAKKSA